MSHHFSLVMGPDNLVLPNLGIWVLIRSDEYFTLVFSLCSLEHIQEFCVHHSLSFFNLSIIFSLFLFVFPLLSLSFPLSLPLSHFSSLFLTCHALLMKPSLMPSSKVASSVGQENIVRDIGTQWCPTKLMAKSWLDIKLFGSPIFMLPIVAENVS